MKKVLSIVTVLVIFCFVITPAFGSTVKVGLNYPKTGPYADMGLDQYRAAELAIGEINASGGILGQQVELVWRDSQSKADVTVANVTDLIDNEGVSMVFGGSSSGVAVAASGVCQQKGVPFFGTLTYSTDTTGKDGHRHTFRECFDAWAGAKAMAAYMNQNYAGKKYFYVTADYTWGWTTEDSFRKFTNTEDKTTHKGITTPFPGASDEDFKKALGLAKLVKPDVLVLVLFGDDMASGIRIATSMGLKETCAIVVPNLTLGMAEAAGPKVMEGVVGALPWCWSVPAKYNYPRGQQFVDAFAAKYNRYPSTSGASAYTIIYEYKAAAERANSIASADIVKSLENHKYTLLKDEQMWRDFDHQSIQTVYVVRCKNEADVLKDKYKLDYFDIISSMAGSEAFITKAEWDGVRKADNKMTSLEPLE
ncbi:MAG: substrate-binding protein [Candidatus Eisenbacteria bacterium]|uniref:Substrate-binding protein n=1 Tax=Eiseniibacteriota bacterium TaxID=2212470 RepID=A0A948RXN3_UNCEI|nr:substrate-binding protein [Candidatus Eisenbacteria bacterium]MBU1947219.1 substrate-binding protein [Candidatus Eisenbacteria bacterium]MBU2690139.1 substrate-binding protein [Candidatus Eisenbacteria bacterium]